MASIVHQYRPHEAAKGIAAQPEIQLVPVQIAHTSAAAVSSCKAVRATGDFFSTAHPKERKQAAVSVASHSCVIGLTGNSRIVDWLDARLPRGSEKATWSNNRCTARECFRRWIAR